MGKVTLHNAVKAAGNGVILELLGEFPAVAVEISGLTAGNATITFKGSVKAKGVYYEQRALNKKTGEVSYTATTDGIYLLDVIGLSYLIADITAYTSGTITAVAQAVPLAISLPGGVIDSNGYQAVKISDGTKIADVTTNGELKVNANLGDVSVAIGNIDGKDAHDAAASGNPVQVGGVYRATDPAVEDGDVASLRVNAKGEAIVQISGSNMELYGAVIGDRPAANTVAAGTTFTIVDDTQEFKTWMANGTDWLEV